MERAVKGGTCTGTLSPAPARHYLTKTSDFQYDIRQGHEGDGERR